MAVLFFNVTWAAPLQIAVALYLLYRQIGAATFVGIGFLFSLFPINGCVFARIAQLRRQMLLHTDKRVKIMNELLLGIRVIKMYAWELAFRRRIDEQRELELRLIERIAYIIAVGFLFVLLAAPLLMPVLVFFTYTALGNELNASIAFTSLALFNVIRFPFSFLPLALQQVSACSVALRRIRRFLELDELTTLPLNEGQVFSLVGAHGRDDHRERTRVRWRACRDRHATVVDHQRQRARQHPLRHDGARRRRVA
jgi:ABC-type multidrug transport system fused ATPase/permease subunit